MENPSSSLLSKISEVPAPSFAPPRAPSDGMTLPSEVFTPLGLTSTVMPPVLKVRASVAEEVDVPEGLGGGGGGGGSGRPGSSPGPVGATGSAGAAGGSCGPSA